MLGRSGVLFRRQTVIFAGMNWTFPAKKHILGLALLAGALLVSWVGWRPARAADHEGRRPETVNLALRRTAHYLLRETGDSTSRIPPVQQLDATTWQLRLEHTFDYERLPYLLEASFRAYGVTGNYNVVVLDCFDSSLHLGYNVLDFQKNREVPCGGRSQDAGCRNVQIRFLPPARASRPILAGGLLALGLLAGWGYTAWRLRPARRVEPGAASPEATDGADDRINFGASSLQFVNQVLITAGVRHNLTYREARLLHLFVSRPNQVLERDFILQQVWADEGVLVGRSIDVFVSRLRKLLRPDPQVRIVTLHGVGYRLEVG
jgi:hypothetical protein